MTDNVWRLARLAIGVLLTTCMAAVHTAEAQMHQFSAEAFNCASPPCQDWSFMYYNPSSQEYHPMDSQGGNVWRAEGTTYCLVGQNIGLGGTMHPQVGCEAVIAWKATMAGTITIQAHIERVTLEPYGDGVAVRIMSSGVGQIWPPPNEGVQLVGLVQQQLPQLPQHIARLDVTANQWVYFHVAARGDHNYDTTIWDPVISYVTPRFTLGKLERVGELPTSSPCTGAPPYYLDSSLSHVEMGGTHYWTHSFGAVPSNNMSCHVRWSGSIENPLGVPPVQASTNQQFYPHDIDPVGRGWWINNLYRSPTAPNRQIAFNHIEDSSGQLFQIGLAYSDDNGATFRRGFNDFEILSLYRPNPLDPPDPYRNIEGVPYFIVSDGTNEYYYVYYNEWDGAKTVLALARLYKHPNDWLPQNADEGWKKWVEPNWVAASSTVRGTALLPNWTLSTCPPKVHSDAAALSTAGPFVLAGAAEWCHADTSGAKRGIWIAYSAQDPNGYGGINWQDPVWIQNLSDRGSTGPFAQYVTIVNADGTDNGRVGNYFYVYWGFAPTWTGPSDLRYIFRQNVRLWW